MPKVIAALALLLALAACTHDQPAPARAPASVCRDVDSAAQQYRWISQILADDRASLARIPASHTAERAAIQADIDDFQAKLFYAKQDWDAARVACDRERKSK